MTDAERDVRDFCGYLQSTLRHVHRRERRPSAAREDIAYAMRLAALSLQCLLRADTREQPRRPI